MQTSQKVSTSSTIISMVKTKVTYVLLVVELAATGCWSDSCEAEEVIGDSATDGLLTLDCQHQSGAAAPLTLNLIDLETSRPFLFRDIKAKQ